MAAPHQNKHAQAHQVEKFLREQARDRIQNLSVQITKPPVGSKPEIHISGRILNIQLRLKLVQALRARYSKATVIDHFT